MGMNSFVFAKVNLVAITGCAAPRSSGSPTRPPRPAGRSFRKRCTATDPSYLRKECHCTHAYLQGHKRRPPILAESGALRLQVLSHAGACEGRGAAATRGALDAWTDRLTGPPDANVEASTDSAHASGCPTQLPPMVVRTLEPVGKAAAGCRMHPHLGR